MSNNNISGNTTNKIKKKPQATGWLVLAIISVVLTIVFAFIIVSMISDSNQPAVTTTCPVGTCKFSTITGIKTCPTSNTESISVSPGLEFCTTKNYCQKIGFECAVQADQTTLCNGVCGPNNEKCRCVRNPTIPS